MDWWIDGSLGDNSSLSLPCPLCEKEPGGRRINNREVTLIFLQLYVSFFLRAKNYTHKHTHSYLYKQMPSNLQAKELNSY